MAVPLCYAGAIEPGRRHSTSTLRHGSRSALLGALVLAAIMGAIAGRRLQRRASLFN